METRFYLVYGQLTLNGIRQRIFVGYIRESATHALKTVSVVKTTCQQTGNGWELLWNLPEIHYQYPLISTSDTVVHDAIQRAYQQEGPEDYAAEYYPYM